MLAAFIGIVAFGVLKLTPVYMGNMKVSTLLEDVKKDHGWHQYATPSKIRNAIAKRINIEMIYDLEPQDFKITRIRRRFFRTGGL